MAKKADKPDKPDKSVKAPKASKPEDTQSKVQVANFKPARMNHFRLPLTMTTLALLIIVVFAVGLLIVHHVRHSGNSAKKITCQSTYNDKDFCAFLKTTAKLPASSYSIKSTSTDAQQRTVSSEIEHDNSDNYKVTTAAFGNPPATTIHKGVSVYLQNNAAHNWLKFTSPKAFTAKDADQVSSLSSISDLKFVAKQKLPVKNLGSSSCGTDRCAQYQLQMNDNSGTSENIWVNLTSHKLYRWVLQNPQQKRDSTITYIDEVIATPSPVVDVSKLPKQINSAPTDLPQ